MPRTIILVESVTTQLATPYLSINLWCSKKLLEVLVALLILITRFAPLRDRFAMEDEDVEVGVEEKDDVGLDGDTIEEDGLRWSVKRV